jgi:hypothetical protein
MNTLLGDDSVVRQFGDIMLIISEPQILGYDESK